MGLISLVYTSIATKPLTDEELKDILAVSRKNNQAVNVTGMLLHKDGHFIQALEGEAEEVNRLYAKIARDPRHNSVYKMYSRAVSERSFGDWSMGFNKLDLVNPDELPGYTDFLSKPFDPTFLLNNPSRTTYMLEFFKRKSLF